MRFTTSFVITALTVIAMTSPTPTENIDLSRRDGDNCDFGLIGNCWDNGCNGVSSAGAFSTCTAVYNTITQDELRLTL